MQIIAIMVNIAVNTDNKLLYLVIARSTSDVLFTWFVIFSPDFGGILEAGLNNTLGLFRYGLLSGFKPLLFLTDAYFFVGSLVSQEKLLTEFIESVVKN